LKVTQKIELFFIEKICWFMIAFFFIAFAITKPVMLNFDFIIFMIYSAIPLGFLVLAQTICLISGNLDLSVAAITGFVGTTAGLYLISNSTFPHYLSILVPISLGIICGIFNGLLIGPLGFNSFLVTLATQMVFLGGRFLVYKSTISGKDLPRAYLLLGGDPILAIVSFIIILIFLYFFLNYIPYGIHLYACGANPDAAFMMGINLKKYRFFAFTLSGLFAGLSALYYTGYNNAVPITMANESLFPSFAGAVIGGVSLRGGSGSVINAFAGTLLLAVIEGGLTVYGISPTERMVAYGLLVVVAIVINKARENIRDKILKPKI
jgi:ribose/xylose/arabinose/galactoside ABC-type transport system permease subunit